MIAADKDNLVTTLAQELLLVREKEMRFYMRNLKMVGTHAALLAGFAFTILAQYEFKVPEQGFLDYEWEDYLNMWPPNSTFATELEKRQQVGFQGWPWQVWCQQLAQLAHLLFTTAGMVLQLWTVYTCVVTNILGLHLALRGPEGSVDRAVKHMASQNQFALRKFIFGLVLFIGSVLFFSLSEYHAFVSVFVCSVILLLSVRMYRHIRGLVAIFYVKQDDTITGQWNLSDMSADKAAPPHGSALRRTRTVSRTSTDVARKIGLSAMGDMLATTARRSAWKSTSRSMRNSGRGSGVGSPAGNAPKRGVSHTGKIAARVEATVKSKPKAGTRWAPLHQCGNMMDDPSIATRARGADILEEQNPSAIAEQLIFKQQKAVPAPLPRQDSGSLRGPSRGARAWRSTSKMVSSIRQSARFDSPAISSRWSTRRSPSAVRQMTLPKGAVLTDSARDSGFMSARKSSVDGAASRPVVPPLVDAGGLTRRGSTLARAAAGFGGSCAGHAVDEIAREVVGADDDSPETSFSFRPTERNAPLASSVLNGGREAPRPSAAAHAVALAVEQEPVGLDNIFGQVLEKLGMGALGDEPAAMGGLSAGPTPSGPPPTPASGRRPPSVAAEQAAARWMGLPPPITPASSAGSATHSEPDTNMSRMSRVSFSP